MVLRASTVTARRQPLLPARTLPAHPPATDSQSFISSPVRVTDYRPSSAPQQAPPVPAPVRQDARPPDLTAPLPTVEPLSGAQRALPQRPSPEYVPWIRDVLFLVDRTVAQQQGAPTTSPPEDSVVLSDPIFARLASDAVQIPDTHCTPRRRTRAAKATYLRSTLHGRGAFPVQI